MQVLSYCTWLTVINASSPAYCWVTFLGSSIVLCRHTATTQHSATVTEPVTMCLAAQPQSHDHLTCYTV